MDMPIRALIDMINRMPANDHWKRLRIALNADELREYREYIKQQGSGTFYHALRGVPIIIEPQPSEARCNYEAI